MRRGRIGDAGRGRKVQVRRGGYAGTRTTMTNAKNLLCANRMRIYQIER